MPTLLFVHHTPSPAMHTLFEAARSGATDPQITGVDVVVEPALHADAINVLDADGYLLGTPANLGYISGALKHFFDQIYYPCLDATVGRPFGLYLHGDNDAAGALRDIGKIVTGLRWAQVTDHVVAYGPIGSEQREALVNLGGTVGLRSAER